MWVDAFRRRAAQVHVMHQIQRCVPVLVTLQYVGYLSNPSLSRPHAEQESREKGRFIRESDNRGAGRCRFYTRRYTP